MGFRLPQCCWEKTVHTSSQRVQTDPEGFPSALSLVNPSALDAGRGQQAPGDSWHKLTLFPPKGVLLP